MPPERKGSRTGPLAPKKRRPRPRRRRIIAWSRIWGTLLICSLVAAPFWSPALRIRRATIVGAEPGSAPHAERALAALRGRSLTRVNPNAIESAAMADLRWGGADLRRSLFGSVRLTLEPRVPVAVVVDTPPLLMDAGGTIYDPSPAELQRALGGLPRVTLGRGLRFSAVAFAAPVDLRRVAELANGLRNILGDTPAGIEVRERGLVLLTIQECRIVLGTLAQFSEKLATLRRVINDQPDLFRRAKEINLMVPDHPRFIERTSGGAATSDTRN